MNDEMLRELQKERDEISKQYTQEQLNYLESMGYKISGPSESLGEENQLENTHEKTMSTDKVKKMGAMKPKHRPDRAFTDAWFLGVLVMVVEPILMLLTYLFLK